MCGLIGFTRNIKVYHSDENKVAEKMCAAITHRGPDSEGIWWDESAPLVLGHRRLSVLDLSPAGHQLVLSACGCYVIAFNGEIYNYLALHEQLAQKETL